MKFAKDLVAASAAPIVLSVLQDGETYGYAIIQRIRKLSAEEIEWTDGMLYPVLHRLEKTGAITSIWRTAENGRRRRYYALKPSGRRALADHRRQWQATNELLNLLWRPQHAG